MSSDHDAALQVAIVDHGLGNLYSVKHACAHVGLRADITHDKAAILSAGAVIIPGVGAFGDAMATLRRLDLVAVLRDVVASGRPLVGICLGLQLIMSESEEFGRHQGLGFVEGTVVRFDHPRDGERDLKVPQIGWNALRPWRSWRGTLLEDVREGEAMYFVHSYTARPADPAVQLSTTIYGGIEFCSSVARENIFACQFHPERSGQEGLKVYRSLARRLGTHTEEHISERVV